MKNLLFAACLSLVFATQIGAQNSILFDEPKDLKLPTDFNKLLPKEIEEKFDANAYLKAAVFGFSRTHLTYREVSFPYSLFVLYSDEGGIYDSFFGREQDNFEYDKSFENLKKMFFKDKSFYEKVYALAMPIYKNVFSKMTNAETTAFLELIKQGLDYANAFDLAKEQTAEAEFSENFAYEKGKICAFVYRRIANKELTKGEAIYWLNKIYSDLKASAPTDKNAANDYVIQSQLGDFYWAAPFGEYDGQKYAVYVKNGNVYKPLAEGNDVKVVATSVQNYNAKYPYCQVAYANGEREVFFFGRGKDNAETLSFKSKADIAEVSYGEKWICIRYKDETVELVYGLADYPNSKMERLPIDKKVIAEKIQHNADIFVLNYEDNSSELFICGNAIANVKRSSFKEKLLDVIQLYATPYTLLKFEGETAALLQIEGTIQKIINLPAKYNYSKIVPWKNYLLFMIAIKDEALAEFDDIFIEKHGILSLDGKLVKEPIFDDIVQIEGADFLLIKENMANNGGYALYDANLKALTKPIYEFEIIHYFDPDVFEEYHGADMKFDLKDKTLIMVHNTYNDGNIIASKATMFDGKGKVLIPEKWPFIQRILLTESAENNFYRVCNKVEFGQDGKQAIGKFALFDHKGKQVTGFLYDAINYSPDGFFECSRKGKAVKLATNGKELK